ncbi:MAG: hypothetical protein FWE38_01840 [Firmicutes bacterium]|nr:hypothetical protein [Bacillota bacterium]
MRRLLFWIILVAAIGFSTLVVLFVENFWAINLTNESGAAAVATGGNGWNMIIEFFRNIADHEWGWNSENVLVYALIVFVLLNIVTLVTLALVFLRNIGMLNRSERLYRNAMWFFFSALVLSAAYIWWVVDVMETMNAVAPTTWGMRTISVWFFIPIGLGLVSAALSGVFKSSELNT